MAKRKDWTLVAIGLGIAGLTIIDVIPADEVAGVPIGLGLALKGLNYI